MGQEVWLCFYGKLQRVRHVCTHAFITHLCYVFAAPAEGLRKHRSFSLTSHQLRALTQLAGTLLGFERTARDLLANTTSVDATGETPGGKGAIHLGFDIMCMNIRPIRLKIPSFLSPTRIEEVEFWDVP